MAKEKNEAVAEAVCLLQAVLRSCITTTITIPWENLRVQPTEFRETHGPLASEDSWKVHGGGEGADDGRTGEPGEGGEENAAATEETLGDDAQPGDPDGGNAAPTDDKNLPSDGAPASVLPMLFPPQQSAAAPGGPTTVHLRWPRRLGSAFRVSVACTTRLQGALRRYTLREAYVAQSSSVLNLVQHCVRRSIVERKYRYALRRDALRVNIPGVVRRSLFLCEEEMDFIDKARYAEYLEMFKQVEALYQQLRLHQKALAATEAECKTLTEYEDTLYNDLTRGGGGGLVRKLGGQRAAKKILQDTQANLEAMNKTRRNQKESVQRLLKDIKWKYEGNFDSLVATEEFVQDGHMRCFPGEYVTIANRYKDNPRFKALSNGIGKLTQRHSEGAWFVSFDLTGCKQGFAAGGEGIFHLKYATNGEMQKTMLTVQQMNKDQRLADEAASRAAAAAAISKRGPTSLTYNRNPIVCYYNLPVTEFATPGDLRYAAQVMNHAACRDPRDRLPSKVLANAISASCWGKDPMTFSWHAKPPATFPPLGLSIDKLTGTVTGTPHFLGDVAVYVTCTDADGYASSTELRFYCEKLPANAVLPEAPRTDNRSKRIEDV